MTPNAKPDEFAIQASCAFCEPNQKIAFSFSLMALPTYEYHKRIVTPLINPFIDIGGLSEFIFTAFWFLYVFIGKPFRNLELAISYSRLLDNASTSLTNKLN